jgi:hypothetical protein
MFISEADASDGLQNFQSKIYTASVNEKIHCVMGISSGEKNERK